MPQIIAGCFPQSGSGRPELPFHEDDIITTSARRGSKSESRSFTFRRLIKSYWSDWVLIVFLW